MNAPIIHPRRPFKSFIVPPCLVARFHPNHCEQLCVPEATSLLIHAAVGSRQPAEYSFTLLTAVCEMYLGLSLIALSPAAEWYFIVIVCCFYAPQGEKTTYKELNMTGKRKS
jgi:hypothetical protein